MSKPDTQSPEQGAVWRDVEGRVLSCADKRKALDENLQELLTQYRDVLDDALLLGCGEASTREALMDALANVKPSVRERI